MPFEHMKFSVIYKRLELDYALSKTFFDDAIRVAKELKVT